MSKTTPPGQSGLQPPSESLYDLLGGESGVRALADRFYDAMDARADVQPLRAMHPPSLDDSRDKLFWFLSGWLGGPPLYVQKKGHPRLRARHLPFAIDDGARDQWMVCMRVALDGAGLDDELRQKLEAGLTQLATHMVNQT